MMYRKKYPIILILISLLVLSLNITSCNPNKSVEYESAIPLPFMFHVFDPGHKEILGNAFVKELKDELNENMIWTAPPYFWAEIEPSDNQFNWDELDNWEAGWRCYAGLVRSDGTPKEAYFRIRDYWNEISGK